MHGALTFVCYTLPKVRQLLCCSGLCTTLKWFYGPVHASPFSLSPSFLRQALLCYSPEDGEGKVRANARPLKS